LPNENAEEYSALQQALREQLQPSGPLDELLVEQVSAAAWRLRRFRMIEAGVLTWTLYQTLDPKAGQKETVLRWIDPYLPEPEAHAQPPQEEPEPKADLPELARQADNTAFGRAFLQDAREANAFVKLGRYGSQIERSLYRALRYLERLGTPELRNEPTEGLTPDGTEG
jgi:hypothetical protein